MAVDRPKANATGKIWDKSATGADKIVAQSQVRPEVMVLDSANDRFGQKAEVNLIVTTKKSLAVEVVSPAYPRGQKISADLIILRRIKSAKEVCAFNGEIETRWFVGHCVAGHWNAFSTAECDRRARERRCDKYQLHQAYVNMVIE